MQEVERIRTNTGHIRVKMSGTNFPDRVEEVRERRLQGSNDRKRAPAFPTLPPSMAVVCRLYIVTGM